MNEKEAIHKLWKLTGKFDAETKFKYQNIFFWIGECEKNGINVSELLQNAAKSEVKAIKKLTKRVG